MILTIYRNSLFLFCLFVVVIFLEFGCQSPTSPPSRIQSSVPQWGMFRHDARHTGNVNTPIEGITGPSGDSVTIKWRIPIDGDLIGSPAIGDNGTIYIGTENPRNWDSSSVYAINLDGTIKWRYTPIHRIWSSPAIGNDGSIYIGTLADDGNGGGLYALSSTGQLEWIHNPGEVIVSSPAVGKDGTIYYTTYKLLKAINPTDGSLKWELSGGDGYCSPSISSDGTIYYSSYGTLTAVNPNGTIKWTYIDSSSTNMDPFGIEIGADGTIYFASQRSRYLSAVNTNGKLKWKYLLEIISADPCLDNMGNIYAATYKFNCIDSTGNLKWDVQFPFTPINFNSPLVIGSNGFVYMGSSLYSALFAYNGQNLMWMFGREYPYNDGGISASPSIYNGSLYFAWDSGPYLYFYCLQ